jgi:hypothetical protein
VPAWWRALGSLKLRGAGRILPVATLVGVVLVALVAYYAAREYTEAGSGTVASTAPGAAKPEQAEYFIRAEAAHGGGMGTEWYEQYLPRWAALEFQPVEALEDAERLATLWFAHRQPGAECAQGAFVDGVSRFVYAWAADSPAEYLRRISPGRYLELDVYANESAHGSYRYLTGEPLPASAEAKRVFEVLWREGMRGVGRPEAYATRCALQIVESKPFDGDHHDGRTRLWVVIEPKFSMWASLSEGLDYWMGPFSVGLPRLTVPEVTLRESVEQSATVLLANLHAVVRTTEGRHFLLGWDLYQAPQNGRWYVDSTYNYYPYDVCWPY